MKKILVLICLFSSINVNSQTSMSNVISITPTKNISGLYIGISSIEHNAVINGVNFSSHNSAFNFGLLYEKEFNQKIKLSIRPGIVLADDIKNNFNLGGKNNSYEYPSVVYEFPLLLVYSVKSNNTLKVIPNYIHFGPVFSYNFAANKALRFNESSMLIPSFASEKETNIKLGFGYDFKLEYVNLRPEFGYNFGFNSLNTNTLPNFNISEIRNNMYSFHFVISQRVNKVIYRKPERKEPTQPPIWKKLFGKKN